jgi:hypothetical protein
MEVAGAAGPAEPRDEEVGMHLGLRNSRIRHVVQLDLPDHHDFSVRLDRQPARPLGNIF